MPSGYPYSKSVRRELFDRVCAGAPRRGGRRRIPTALDNRRAEWRVRLHGVRESVPSGVDPRLGMLAVAERIMLRGNRYALDGGAVAAVGAGVARL
jgi:hypothetical protein